MRRLPIRFVAGAIVFQWSATAALADVGRIAPADVWWAWDFDPLVLFILGVASWLYDRGRREMQRRMPARHSSMWWRGVLFYAAIVLIGFTLLSPLDAVSQELSAAHMVQHMLLMIVAAPLLVFSAPALTIAYAMPPLWRQLIGLQLLTHRLTWNPVIVWCLFAAMLWGWHHPILYHAALRDPLVHDAQHLSFFFAAFLFWRPVLDPLSRRRLHPLAVVPYLFTTSLHASALGVFLALAPEAWYSDYASRTSAFGLTPLADQQLAGMIMWVPGCLVYPLIAVAVFGRWLAGLTSQSGLPIDALQSAIRY